MARQESEYGFPLSKAEMDVMQLLAEGHTTNSAAARLGITRAAVGARSRRAREKTGSPNTVQCVAVLALVGKVNLRSPVLLAAAVAYRDARR